MRVAPAVSLTEQQRKQLEANVRGRSLSARLVERSRIVLLAAAGARDSDKVQRWLGRHKRFHLHFTPTSASWRNMIERFFRDLTCNRVRRGVFTACPRWLVRSGNQRGAKSKARAANSTNYGRVRRGRGHPKTGSWQLLVFQIADVKQG